MTAPEQYGFGAAGGMPNSPLPLLIYRGALAADAVVIERVFAAHAWPPRWRAGVYPWHHFHPHAHEVRTLPSDNPLPIVTERTNRDR